MGSAREGQHISRFSKDRDIRKELFDLPLKNLYGRNAPSPFLRLFPGFFGWKKNLEESIVLKG
jgi:hypothetical protein